MKTTKELIKQEELECKELILKLLKDKGISLYRDTQDISLFEIFLLAVDGGLTISSLFIINRYLRNLMEMQNKHSKDVPHFKSICKKITQIDGKTEIFWDKEINYCGIIYKPENAEDITLIDAYVIADEQHLTDNMTYIFIDGKKRHAYVVNISLVKEFPKHIDIN